MFISPNGSIGPDLLNLEFIMLATSKGNNRFACKANAALTIYGSVLVRVIAPKVV